MAFNLTRILKSLLLREENTLTPKELEIVPGGSASTKTTVTSSQTTNQTITIPDATDTLVGKATTDTLSSKTLAFLRQSVIDDSTTTGTNATLVALTTGIVRLTNVSLSSISAIPAGVSGQSIIVENKTGTTLTINNEDTGIGTAANRLLTGTGAPITMLIDATFIFTYDSTSSRWSLTGGSGSGSGSGFKNILSDANSKLEGGIQDWVTYDDGASSSPVDGTAGSPSVITISSTSSGSEILEGLKSLKISKSAADGQGEGTSVLSQTIDRADRGKPFFVYLSYDATHANYVYGDLQVFAYDVTNSQLLTVYNDDNNGKLAQVKGRFSGVIYTQDTTASIRLIVHCTSINATAYNVIIDEVVITPQANITGPVMTDWQTFPYLTAGGTAASPGNNLISAITAAPSFGSGYTLKALYRRVGANLEIAIDYYQTNAGGAGTGMYVINLPPGLSIDTSKIDVNTGTATSNTSQSSVVGTFYDSLSTTIGIGQLIPYSATQIKALYQVATTAGVSNAITWSSTEHPFSTAGFSWSLRASMPIQDWSAGATLSANDAGLQTVRMITNTSTTAGTTSQNFIFTNVVHDNYNGYSVSTGKFTIPRTGIYRVTAAIGVVTNAIFNVRQNGIVISTYPAAASGSGMQITGGSIIYPFVKGDLVDIAPGSSITAAGGATKNYFMIESIPDFNTFGVQGPIIVGATTDWSSFEPLNIGAVTTAPSKGTTAVDTMRYRRDGTDAIIEMNYRQTAVGSAGSGVYLYSLPGGLSFAPEVVGSTTTTVDVNSNFFGTINVSTGLGNTETIAFVIPYDSTRFWLMICAALTDAGAGTASVQEPQSSTIFALSNTKLNIKGSFRVAIQGWSSETRLYPTQRVIGTTYLKDVKTSGTAGGPATSGPYQTRVLNTQEGDTGFCSLSSNQFTLQPGTYEIEATAPAHSGATGGNVGHHRIKIYNITDSSDAILGSGAYVSTPTVSNQVTTHTFLYGRIIVTGVKTFELQHKVQTTYATNGFGVGASFGDSEVYSIVKIDKIY